MNEKIKVVMLVPGEKATIEEIETDLESLQNIVGGLIEAYYPFEEEVCMVCNDDGKLMGLPLNRAVKNDSGEVIDIIAGTAFICSCATENFSSLTDEQLEYYQDLFLYPQTFAKIGDEILAINILDA